MSKYEITIDPSLCSGYGACVDAARELFRLERGGVATAVVTQTDDPAALDAADACPMGAIFVAKARAA
jgi:ferredoxin